MRRYETIFILDPDLSEEGRVPVFQRLEELIPSQGGTLFEIDQWGARKLAYEIKKRTRGYYTRLDYCGPAELVDEMERGFRIDDRVLKYMTVLVDEEPDIDKIKEEMTEAEEAEAEETPAAETAEAAEADAPAEKAEENKEDAPEEKTETTKEAE